MEYISCIKVKHIRYTKVKWIRCIKVSIFSILR